MHSLENFPCSMNNLNIWDSPEFLHKNSIKNSIHDFAIKSGCLFFGRWPFTYKSSRFYSSVFNEVPHSLIYRFQEGFHPYFSMGIVIPIKVRRDHKRVTMFHVWETTPPTRFYKMLGQTHVNGWSHVIVSQNGDSTSYIFPFKLRVLQWSRHLFNYWKNKKTMNEKFLILLIWNWIYIDHRKITWLWS